MTTPDWWEAVLLALAAWRVYHLIAFDTILDGPRNLLCGLPWAWKDSDPVPRSYRARLGDFIQCPYCMGFHVSLAWWGAFQCSPKWSVILATPWAISAALVWIHARVDGS